jgi:tetratricopeptide (TPR) repeat protein
MQRVGGMRNPLMEASAVRRGSRLAFRHGGALVDPLTQQLAFDFDTSRGRQLSVVRPGHSASRQAAEVQEMFVQAVKMEENPASIPSAIQIYEAILELRPEHAPALINLGTIHYNLREYEVAEGLYRRATLADPEYALAFFDLGNVLDEMQQLEEATAAYQKAVSLVPQYADAHYNLALAYERQGHRRRALRHWLMYVRLDPAGPWSSHARDQARKILSAEKLSIVSRGGRPVKVAG